MGEDKRIAKCTTCEEITYFHLWESDVIVHKDRRETYLYSCPECGIEVDGKCIRFLKKGK